MPSSRARVLTFRYVGALLAVAGLLVIGQLLVQRALDHQEGDSRVVNIAGRQRMLSQRLTMLLLAMDLDEPAHLVELAQVAKEWERAQAALQRGSAETGLRGGNSDAVRNGFARIEADHRALLAAAYAAIAGRPAAPLARAALDHQDVFLDGMDRIVAAYEAEARARVIRLRQTELALLVLALAVLALEGAFVFRPAVRDLRAYLAERDRAERQLVEVSDREQRRIAQDLHDGLGQHLVGVAFLVKSLERQVAGGPHEAAIAEVGRLLADAIDQTRSLARTLYAHALEGAGLMAALHELAAHTERLFGVPCRVHGDTAELALPMTVRVHLHRIAREAVANAAKHAGATAIDIELTHDGSRLHLAVRDDGVGIPPVPLRGMGLHLMEYRARMLGIVLRVAAAEARGTVVSCTLPLRGLRDPAIPGAPR